MMIMSPITENQLPSQSVGVALPSDDGVHDPLTPRANLTPATASWSGQAGASEAG